MTPNPICARKAMLTINKISFVLTLVALMKETCSLPKGLAKRGGLGNLKGGILTPLSTSSVSLLWEDFLFQKEGEGIENWLKSLNSTSTVPSVENFGSSFTDVTMVKDSGSYYQVKTAKMVLI